MERQYQDYLVSGEPVFIASRSTRQLAILNDKNKLKEERKATIPKILANPGARKVINEEALALGEKYTIQRSGELCQKLLSKHCNQPNLLFNSQIWEKGPMASSTGEILYFHCQLVWPFDTSG